MSDHTLQSGIDRSNCSSSRTGERSDGPQQILHETRSSTKLLLPNMRSEKASKPECGWVWTATAQQRVWQHLEHQNTQDVSGDECQADAGHILRNFTPLHLRSWKDGYAVVDTRYDKHESDADRRSEYS